ncbi:MAG: LysR family transcriptional regulator [Nitratireductor sp.]|nr:LysR family transcriptional regulator [Nitratireductor sp.]
MPHALPLLELDVLKTVVAIAETGNFSSAAEAVLRTPSAVSMQVKKLEDILGRPIFVRDSRSVSLTPDGEVVLQHARRVIALNQDIVSQFITPEVAGVVRLGAPDDVAEQMLPSMLRRFAQSHPCVTVDVVVDYSGRLIERVRNRTLDVTIFTCGARAVERENGEVLKSEPLVWAGAKGGIAHEKRPVPISVWEEGCIWRETSIGALMEAGIEHRIAFQSSHISGQKAAILADLVVAPIPISSLDERMVRLDGKGGLPDLPMHSLAMITADNLSNPAKAAADHLRACFAKPEAARLAARPMERAG